MTSKASPYTIGVLIQPTLQLLDLASVDLFGMLSTTYLDDCPLPAPLRALAHSNIKTHYISALGSGGLQKCTADVVIQCSDGLDSPDVAPGNLDVLLVPGPAPGYVPSEDEKKFIKGQFDSQEARNRSTVILSVCTGIFAVAYAGILNGEVATGPRGLLGDFKRKFPRTTWVEKRWVECGKGRIWVSGEFKLAYLWNGSRLLS